ncbi:hypothetical protein PoB_002296000 [Plakobranchus ocellatus]|uniref:Nuclear transcription factor Y subunit n=1 Tax=Plakobranchus ocellatus TaxID=259542 RepID=A0AAV3ZLB1_9GAST|nr:hypothetical protein PoB_002296000 [Plakobranchus ocellatus]
MLHIDIAEQSYSGSLAIFRFQAAKAQTHSPNKEGQCPKSQQKRLLKRRRLTPGQQSGPGGQYNMHSSMHKHRYHTMNREEQTKRERRKNSKRRL